MNLERYQEALNDLNTAIHINTKQANFYTLRGKLFLLLSKPLKACKDFAIASKWGHDEATKLYNNNCK
jgi:hypothetical protein